MNYWNEIKDKLDTVYNALQDEESRELFDARVQYMVDRDSDAYINTIFELNKQYPKKWRCPEMEKVLEDGQEIIIYGCGHDGRMLKRVLEICGYSIAYWCDSNANLWGTYIEDIRIVSPEELGEKYGNSLVVIGSKQYENADEKKAF